MFPRDVTQASKNYGGVSYSGVSWGDYTNDVGGSVDNGTCDIDHTDGYDLVWEVALNSGEALRASVQTDGGFAINDPSMSIRSTCGDVSASNCLGGEDADDAPAEATYVASQNETVYVIGDSDDSDSSESWSAEIETFSSACSSSGTSCNSQGDVRICSSSGAVPDRFTCGSGCSNGFCTPRNSETCYDAENITSQLASSGGLDKTVDFGNFNNDYEFDGCGGSIDDFEVDGPDAVYAVDMTANDVLSATLEEDGFSFDQPSLYVVTGCLDPGSQCLVGNHDSDTASVSYTASSAETVFLVADVDDGTNDDFKLTGSLSQPVCNPGAKSCASGDFLSCNASGSAEVTVCSSCCSTVLEGSSSPGSGFSNGSPTTDTLSLGSCSGSITSVIVPINIDHPYETDVELDLTSPAGTTVELEQGNGAFSAFPNGTYGVDLSSAQNLSNFNGENPSGTWSIEARDVFSGFGSGTLNSWGVAVACQ
jgi:hypothetical protein